MARTRRGTRDIQIHKLTFANAERPLKSFSAKILQTSYEMARGYEEQHKITGNHVIFAGPTLPKHYPEIRPSRPPLAEARDDVSLLRIGNWWPR
jgi:hypothetical protein